MVEESREEVKGKLEMKTAKTSYGNTWNVS